MQHGADRRAAAPVRLERIVLRVHEVKLDRRRRTENSLRLARILHTRELHEDAVQSLPLDNGLRNAELIHAIAQRQRVLLNREILTLAQRGLGEAHAEPGASAGEGGRLHDQPARHLAELHELIAAVEVPDDLLGALEVRGLDDWDGQPISLDVDVVTDIRLAQLRAQRGLVGAEILLNRRIEIHLVHEMHAAAQIEAQSHRLQADGPHPTRCARRECQSYDVIRQLLAQHFARAQLLGVGRKPHHYGIVLDGGARERDVGVGQCGRRL